MFQNTSLTVQQILQLAATINGAVAQGKVAIEDLLAFLASKGVDQQQLDANRALLVSDIDEMSNELRVPVPPVVP